MEAAPAVYSGAYTGAIELSPAADSYSELEAVAAEIIRLVREENYRYKDIGVVARDPGAFAREIDSAFARMRIPHFMSAPEDVENQPLAAGVVSALNAARGFDTANVLLFAKSPLLGLTPEEAALLENYCYCWDIRGSLWHSEFTANPRGLAGAMAEADLKRLSEINAIRARVAEPLLRLRERLRQNDAAALAKGVYELLAEINAAENLLQFNERLEDSARLWDSLMEILDIFGSVLKGREIPAARLCELFRLSLSAAKTASPPETLDQVIVGGADRIRPEKLRAVFVIGANENVFPAQAGGGGLFSEAEREELSGGGLELAPTGLQRAALEKYFAYFALTLASERVCVSWPKADLKGRELLPSAIVEQLRAMFPDIKESVCSGEDWLSASDESALALMERAAEKPPHSLGKEAAEALFGRDMRLSPSKVERFYKCPFSYFAADGLKVRRRGRVVFTGLEYGSAVHHVLQVMLARHGGAALAELETIGEEVEEILREYLEEVTGGGDIPERLKFLFGRIGGTLVRLLRRLGQEFAQSGFAPYALELPIETGGEVEPLRLLAPDGAAVTVEGKVDRIDIMEKDGRRFVRVVDYKSGAKSFALGDILYGLNLQMLLYLFTIAKNGKGGLGDSIPAGVLYMPAREGWLSAGRGIETETAAKEHAKGWRMSGLLLDDEDVLRGMERELAGVYIPVKLGKDGKPDAASQIASAAEFANLAKKVERQITAMAEELGAGKIAAMPVRASGGLTCEYCDYPALCGFEEGDESVTVRSLNKQEFFEIIGEEESQ
jgi:ATP-dependent helicase/nuclease subunit B